MRVDTVIPGRIPAFEEMEPDVKIAWLGEQKQQAWQKAYKEMGQVHLAAARPISAASCQHCPEAYRFRLHQAR